MAKAVSRRKQSQQEKLDQLLQRAHQQWAAGSLRSAFRLFLSAARSGEFTAQLVIGNFYSEGIGVKPNRELALKWYRRAYRQGYGSAASNIGILFRDEHKFRRALKWFERAVKLHDADANLEIAKIYLERDELKKAVRYLRAVCKAKPNDVTEASKREAQLLLAHLGSE